MEKFVNTPTETIVNLVQNEQHLTIEWADSQHSIFHYIWLRDNCPNLLQPESGQRKFNPVTIPTDVHPKTVQINANQQIEIVWAYDEHVSQFDSCWLRTHCYTNKKQKNKQGPKLWDAAMINPLSKTNYDDICTNPESLKTWLTGFRDYGFGILENVPIKSKMLLEVADRLSYVWSMNWEEDYFDVKATIASEFLAFTNLPLLSHTDDAYFEPAPPAQMVSCLTNDVEGGESTLVDGFKVATVLKERAPQKFKLLSSLPIQYRYCNQDYDLAAEAPLIRLNVLGELEQIRFSNQSLQPFQHPVDVMEAYYDAYCTFSRMAESDEFQVRFKLKPGDLYLSNNYRILHGRTGFASDGNRHMQGGYVGGDGLLSRLAVLSR